MTLSWPKLIVLGLFIVMGGIALSWAQIIPGTIPPTIGTVVATCGTGPSYTAGQYAPITVNTAGSLCVNQ